MTTCQIHSTICTNLANVKTNKASFENVYNLGCFMYKTHAEYV